MINGVKATYYPSGQGGKKPPVFELYDNKKLKYTVSTQVEQSSPYVFEVLTPQRTLQLKGDLGKAASTSILVSRDMEALSVAGSVNPFEIYWAAQKNGVFSDVSIKHTSSPVGATFTYDINWEGLNINNCIELTIDKESDGVADHSMYIGGDYSDTLAPTTTPTLTGTNLTPDTYLGTTTLTLTAADNEGGVGVEKTEYSFDGEVWYEYTTPIEVTEEGSHTIYYRSTDWFGNMEELKSVTFTIIADDTAPETTLAATGTGGPTWFRSDITVTLTATDDKTGVASTTYSLDNGTTWLDYSAPFTLTGEGEHTVLYRSTDKAGNTEDTKTATLYIDLTAPEAKLSANVLTKDLLVTGNDNMGSTTVAETTTGYTITDEAGHTTKLLVTKKWAGKALTMAQLTGIQYDDAPVVTLPKTQLLYVWTPWQGATNLTNQTVHVNKTFTVNATYLKPLNRTTVTVAKEGKVGKPQTFPDLKLVTLTTVAGVIGYEL